MRQINILYAPGLGGNHLANLVAMDPKFGLELDLTIYDQSSENVHQLLDRCNDIVEIRTMHMGQFVTDCKNNLISSSATNILLMLPQSDTLSLAYQRLISWAPEYRNSFIFAEHKAIYSNFVTLRVSKQHFFSLSSNVLFDNNTATLTGFLDSLDIAPDPAKLCLYHEKWLTKMQNFVKEKLNL